MASWRQATFWALKHKDKATPHIMSVIAIEPDKNTKGYRSTPVFFAILAKSDYNDYNIKIIKYDSKKHVFTLDNHEYSKESFNNKTLQNMNDIEVNNYFYDIISMLEERERYRKKEQIGEAIKCVITGI